MRRLFAFCFAILCFFPNIAQAQLPDNSLAPDWVLKDINGKEHHLYDYLNAGKTVYLDFTATWCAPCWTYHNSDHLNNLYDQYGPNGTDELMVFMIEGDITTNSDDLNGSGPNTWGNWLTNTHYPIIDDYSMTNAYGIAYWPTIYKICPNKRLVEVGKQTTAVLYACLDDCANPVGSHNVSILTYDGEEELFCDSKEVMPSIIIQNEGVSPLASCTIEFRNNGTLIDVKQWTGTLGAFQSAAFQFPSITLYDDANFTFLASRPNGFPDEQETNNGLDSIQFLAPQAAFKVELSLHTDHWPDEIDWELRNDAGVILYSADQMPPLAANTAYHYTFEFAEAACYEFEIWDAYGDGLLNGPNGSGPSQNGAILLESEAGVIWDDHNYGFGKMIPFEVSEMLVANTEITTQNRFELFPNPSNDKVQLDLQLTEAALLNIHLLNSLGQQIKSIASSQIFPQGISQIAFSVDNLPAGIYMVAIWNGEQVQMKRLIRQ